MTELHPDAIGITTLTIRPDLSGLARALVRWVPEAREAMRTLARAISKLLEPLRRMREHLAEHANSPEALAGLEGRYAVRAGLDPAYATPQALDGLVQLVMRGDARRTGDGQLRLLTSQSRSLVAAAAIRGWCYSYGDGPAILAWHRLMGTSIVVVTRG